MNTENTPITIIDELTAICAGRCVWCTMQKPHPAYSLCTHSEWHENRHGGTEGAQQPAIVIVTRRDVPRPVEFGY